MWNREEALKRIRKLPSTIVEDIARVIETADAQGDYVMGDDGGSVYEDDATATLNELAKEIRGKE